MNWKELTEREKEVWLMAVLDVKASIGRLGGTQYGGGSPRVALRLDKDVMQKVSEVLRIHIEPMETENGPPTAMLLGDDALEAMRRMMPLASSRQAERVTETFTKIVE